jgi:uncharacterized protein YjbI with pentapeptide repeats
VIREIKGHRASVRALRQGCIGPGQLDIANVDASNLPVGACDLRLSRFTGCCSRRQRGLQHVHRRGLDAGVRARRAAAQHHLGRAELDECDLRGPDLSVDLDQLSLGTNASTRFVGCDLRGAVFTGRRALEV